MRKLALVGITLCLLSYLLRDPLASLVARVVIAYDKDLDCEPNPQLDLDATLRVVRIAPIRCVIATGPIREFASQTELRAYLRFGRLETVRVERASIDERERDLSRVHMNSLQELADAAGFTHEMAQSMLDSAESYSADQPGLFVEALSVARGGKHQSVMRHFRKTLAGQWIRTQSDVVDSGEKTVSVTDLDMRVTPSRGISRVTIRLGEAGPALRLEMTGDRLETPTPLIQLRLR